EIQAANLDGAKYTEESWNNLQNALEEAEEILNDSEVTQEDVDKALEHLNEAYEGLEEKQEDEVDKAALQEKVDEIKDEDLDESNYTGESWKTFQIALTIAEEILALDTKKLNQSIVDKALSNLEIAYEELEMKSEEEEIYDISLLNYIKGVYSSYQYHSIKLKGNGDYWIPETLVNNAGGNLRWCIL